jgi:hypothetical protein
MKLDPEFESFSRAVAGVFDVEFLQDSYCAAVQSPDLYPVNA